jgi:deazaflavin-dependent oxidoreductase (nitroreductase family)
VTDASESAQQALARWASRPLVYLTTVGRRTGRPHRIEIWFAVEDRSIYLLSGGRERSDWVRNALANPRVSIDIGGERLAGVARVLEAGTDRDRRARDLIVGKYRRGNELEEWSRTSLAVEIEVEATGHAPSSR